MGSLGSRRRGGRGRKLGTFIKKARRKKDAGIRRKSLFIYNEAGTIHQPHAERGGGSQGKGVLF